MEALFWIMLANAAMWIGLGAYVAFLAFRQQNLQQRIRREVHHA